MFRMALITLVAAIATFNAVLSQQYQPFSPFSFPQSNSRFATSAAIPRSFSPQNSPTRTLTAAAAASAGSTELTTCAVFLWYVNIKGDLWFLNIEEPNLANNGGNGNPVYVTLGLNEKERPGGQATLWKHINLNLTISEVMEAVVQVGPNPALSYPQPNSRLAIVTPYNLQAVISDYYQKQVNPFTFSILQVFPSMPNKAVQFFIQTQEEGNQLCLSAPSDPTRSIAVTFEPCNHLLDNQRWICVPTQPARCQV